MAPAFPGARAKKRSVEQARPAYYSARHGVEWLETWVPVTQARLVALKLTVCLFYAMRRVDDEEDRANGIASRGLLAVNTMSVQREEGI